MQGLQHVQQGLQHWAASQLFRRNWHLPSCQFHRNMTNLFLKRLISQVIFRLHYYGPKSIIMGGPISKEMKSAHCFGYRQDCYAFIVLIYFRGGGANVRTRVCWAQETTCGSLLLPCGSQGSNSGHRVWHTFACWAARWLPSCLFYDINLEKVLSCRIAHILSWKPMETRRGFRSPWSRSYGQLWGAMCVLGTGPGSSARVVGTFNGEPFL